MSELDSYNYEFPQELIAQSPAKPRDSARLLVYRKSDRSVFDSDFLHLADHLPAGAVLVFNRTKVVPARLTVYKPTGGRVNLLYVRTEGETIRVMADRKLAIGSRLRLTPRLSFEVIEQRDRYYLLRPSFPMSRILATMERHGRAPLPPYIKESPLSEKERRREYQTVFAEETGSVAAPTASLHFSRRLLTRLRLRGIDIKYVTLHVGLGTFAPVTDDQLAEGKLHAETYRITPATARFLEKARQEDRPIIAVGTTVCRTLESAATRRGSFKELQGETRLFIRPGYEFKTVDGLITNFHVPKSSLMMLVSALTGREELLHIYQHAISERYRLFSFGDGMLII